MTFLVLGIALFFGIHAVGSLGLRPAAVGALGEGPWKGLYSLVSFIGLGLIAWGYGMARTSPTVVWLPPMGLRHLVLLLMVPVFPMLLAQKKLLRAYDPHPERALASGETWIAQVDGGAVEIEQLGGHHPGAHRHRLGVCGPERQFGGE